MSQCTYRRAHIGMMNIRFGRSLRRRVLEICSDRVCEACIRALPDFCQQRASTHTHTHKKPNGNETQGIYLFKYKYVCVRARAMFCMLRWRTSCLHVADPKIGCTAPGGGCVMNGHVMHSDWPPGQRQLCSDIVLDKKDDMTT